VSADGRIGDPTRRFTDRAADYARGRPSYPGELVDVLREGCGLDRSWVVADVGSGTGNLSRLFLDAGNRVEAVEPNREMREAAERALAGQPDFHSVEGRAEATGLAAGSVDLVAAGQAFHWFDRELARGEFRRILRPRPERWIGLIWNDRQAEAGPFMRDYEALLEHHGEDYRQVKRLWPTDDDLARFFGDHPAWKHSLPNEQLLDREGLRARARSSSYVPAPGLPGHRELMQALDALFDRHARQGRVSIPYVTRVWVGGV
jgi:SAM-dependent methyltransferase